MTDFAIVVDLLVPDSRQSATVQGEIIIMTVA